MINEVIPYYYITRFRGSLPLINPFHKNPTGILFSWKSPVKSIGKEITCYRVIRLMQVFLNYTKKAIKLREMVGERFKPFGFSDISY